MGMTFRMHENLVRNLQQKSQRYKLEDIIEFHSFSIQFCGFKIDITKIRYGRIKWIQVAQFRIQWCNLLKFIINFGGSKIL
jgi:hypothetical protein